MNRVVLLTGGTGKFGRVLSAYFLRQGWRVVTTSRSAARLAALAAELDTEPDANAQALLGLEADLQQPGAVKQLLEELTAQGVAVTHLVNNARSLDTLAVNSDGLTSREAFAGEFEMDVLLPYELTMGLACAAGHRLQAVVNIGSMYGEVAPNPALYGGSLDRSPIQYGVSKAGLHHLTRELAVRLAPQNIRVNCVAFGGVEGRVPPDFISRYAQLVPMRRMLQESEIIGPVDFLLGDVSAAVNGHVLVADGGWSVW